MTAVIGSAAAGCQSASNVFKEGLMRSRVLVGALLLVGTMAAGSSASNGAHGVTQKQWAIVNFGDPVLVQNRVLMGSYLIVHDDEKMARGEPCTSIYRFDAA